jgi:hypothetical protein
MKALTLFSLCRLYTLYIYIDVRIKWQEIIIIVRRKPRGQSRMDNPEIWVTLGTRHRMKTNKTKQEKHNTEN